MSSYQLVDLQKLVYLRANIMCRASIYF